MFGCVRLPVAVQIHPSAIDFRGFLPWCARIFVLGEGENNALFAILAKSNYM
jgi:hypothetical protein